MTIIRRTTVVIATAIACLALTAPAGASGPYSSGGLTVSNSTPEPGRSITVRASGFRPNSRALITLDTSPPVSRSKRVSGTGEVSAKLRIPVDASGGHEIAVFGVASDGSTRNVSTSITVARVGRRSAATGIATTSTAIAAGVALPAAAVLVVGSRVRRRSSRG